MAAVRLLRGAALDAGAARFTAFFATGDFTADSAGLAALPAAATAWIMVLASLLLAGAYVFLLRRGGVAHAH